MRSLKLITILLSAFITAIGLVVMVTPLAVLEFGRLLQTPGSLYVIAAVRVAFGVLLVWVASASRMPRFLRVIGAVIIVAGLLTPLFGIERTHAILSWWAGQGLLFMRSWSILPIVIGVFLIYAVGSPAMTTPIHNTETDVRKSGNK